MKDQIIKSEAVAAALVVDYLESVGLDVYQEVDLGGCVADIVAVRGKEVWIVEVKTSWSLDLLQQLQHHRERGHVNRIFAAVPICKGWHDRSRLFQRLGFGTICIMTGTEYSVGTQIKEMATRISPRPLGLCSTLKVLQPGHKTHAKAGAPSAAGRYTPFRKTCDALIEIVTRKPGMSMKEAVTGLAHHYSSDACARASLMKWAEAGSIKGIVLVRNGRKVSLYLEGAQIPVPAPTSAELPTWCSLSLNREGAT